MNLAAEQAAIDRYDVADMLTKAKAAGKLVEVVLQFGNHRETGCTASEAACYAMSDCEVES